ncbi:hypothetical protein [Roseibium aggregatum]|uniref:hypothetical protein n=1 Tax=Roseibium aggregatum TaxID=187304 RepID=UPI00095BAC2C|nr:hypothetical protein [Roseibium aggregatum]UFI03818.1 hypothetical protein ST40_001385 [Roseibium aggregatum]
MLFLINRILAFPMVSDAISYSGAVLAAIAGALRVDLAEVVSRRHRFEETLFWSGLGRSRSDLVPSTDLITRVTKLQNSLARFLRQAYALARRDGEDLPEHVDPAKLPTPSSSCHRSLAASVFQCLGVDPADAIDGIEDRALSNALTDRVDRDEQPLIALIVSLAAFEHDRAGAINATRELIDRCTRSIDTLTRIRGLTVQAGHHGDGQINSWLDDMLGLYEELTGKPVGMSVGAPGSDRAGEVSGRLIDFLVAAGKPVGLGFSPEAWRSRVRTAQRSTQQKQS